jgi:hypothetical protein
VTLAMAVYGQPLMLGVWFDTLRTYTSEMLAEMELIIVDDCGDPAAEIPEDIQAMLPCRLYRVTKDIPWNQPGARNLAIDKAATKLILFVDPDMVFPARMMEKMLDAGAALEPHRVIRFQLRHRLGRAKGHIDASSPNTWFLHVEDFRRIGGYDEDYSGHKGWSDVQLLDIMRTVYKVRHDPTLFAEFYAAEEIPDAMVSTLDRNTKHNKYQRLGKVRQANLTGGWGKFARDVVCKRPRLRFEWEQVL